MIDDDNLINLSDEKLKEKLLSETNIDTVNDIIDVFNVNLQKKNVARLITLNNLQDKISAEMWERITQKGDQFSNKDLIDFFKAVQDTLNRQDDSISAINSPAIQINQQQLNLNVNTDLNNDSREKVLDVVRQLINGGSTEILDIEEIQDD